MRTPRAAGVRARAHRRRRGERGGAGRTGARHLRHRLAQQPGDQHASLHGARTRHGGRTAPDELRGDGRPGGVPIALVGGQAGEARGAAGHDDRADRHAGTVEDHRHMRHVVRHESGGDVGRDVMVGEQYDRLAVGRQVRCRPRRRDPGRPERLRHVGARRGVDAVGRAQSHRPRRVGTGERRREQGEERVELAARHVQRGRQPLERARLDAPFHRVENALLPGGRVAHRHDGVRAELQGRLVPPEGGVCRIQAQEGHGPIVRAARCGRRGSPQPRPAARAAAGLWTSLTRGEDPPGRRPRVARGTRHLRRPRPPCRRARLPRPRPGSAPARRRTRRAAAPRRAPPPPAAR